MTLDTAPLYGPSQWRSGMARVFKGSHSFTQGRIQKMNLEGANSGGLGDGSPPAGSRGGAPVGGLGDEVPEKLTTFRS